MERFELTGKLDALRLEIAALLDGREAPADAREDLQRVLHLLTAAADAAEEGGL